MKLGSHVGMSGKEMLLGSAKEAVSYGANTFMVLFWLPMSLLSRKRLRWKREAIFIRITW